MSQPICGDEGFGTGEVTQEPIAKMRAMTVTTPFPDVTLRYGDNTG
ncbi:hypothetical protein KCP78_11505 [Salmonella enterica subsp. enterica]|nr:hypothetical protein KCP78_11505 [Salmonella enterica subsp. enterica]